MYATSTGSQTQPSGPHGLARVAARFERATADLLRRRALLRRTDTKFLMSSDQIVDLVLEGAGPRSDLHGVSIVEVKQARLQRSSVRTNGIRPVLRALERIQR